MVFVINFALSRRVHCHQSHNMKDEDEIDGAQWLAWDSLGPFLDLGPPALGLAV